MKKFSSNVFDKKIYDKTWYNYNINSGYYDTFNFTNELITYNKTGNDDTEVCNKYYFNKRNKTINFDCGKKIKIINIEENKITLNINDKDYVFYDSIDDSLNYEFKSYFGKNISDYKNEMKRVLDLIKIKPESMKELFLEDNYSKFIFVGDNCNNYECVITLNSIEKWITNTENVYYVDLDNTDQEYLNEINEIDNSFSNNKFDYERVYPYVVITYNGKVIDKYDIKCNGFDCSMFEKNEF